MTLWHWISFFYLSVTHTHIISRKGDETRAYTCVPSPKLHAAVCVMEQVINHFPISHITDAGRLDNTEYLSFLFFFCETPTQKNYIGDWGWEKRIHSQDKKKTACGTLCRLASDKPLLNIRHYRCGTTWQHIVTFSFLDEHTHTHICISERGWDKGIHSHPKTKTACGSWCREASNKSLLNITRYSCGMTLQHWVSFYFFWLSTHTYTHIYQGRGMRQGNTLTCQQQNYMPHLVSHSKV